MGKVILTERQYKNLKRNLISKSINESNNQKKRILNEVGYYYDWIDVDFVNLTLTVNKHFDFERTGGGSELRLLPGAVLQKDGTDLTSDGPASLVGDYSGGLEETLNEKITYSCSSKTVKIGNRDATFFPENVPTEIKRGFDDLCNSSTTASDPASDPNNLITKWIDKYSKGEVSLFGPNAEDVINKLTPDEKVAIFQHFWWGKVEYDKTGGVDPTLEKACKVKYASRLCGSKPCIRSQAIDGKLGANTKMLMGLVEGDPKYKKFFTLWIMENIDKKGPYGKYVNIKLPADCSKFQKVSTAPVKNVNPTSKSRGGGGGSTGGGGTGGGGTGANELSGYV